MADTTSFEYLSLERRGNVFIITMRRGAENRLNTKACQEMIRAFNSVREILGPESEGAVITRGNDAKYFCTVLVAVLRSRNKQLMNSLLGP